MIVSSLRAAKYSLVVLTAALFASPSPGAIPFPRQPSNTVPIMRMRSGEISAADPKNKELLGDLAKYLAHRIVHPPFNGEDLKKKIPGVHEDFETLLTEADRYFTFPNPRQTPISDMQLEYARELGKEMAAELMYVMTESVKKLERVNAARMMAMAGKLPSEDLADAYLKIVREDKYPDEIKMFAYQGLRNLLSIPDPRDPTKHFMRVTKDRNILLEIFQALDKVVTKPHAQKVTFDEAMVIQYVRREAVRAMAQFKYPVLRNNQRETVGKPIWTLIRVARNDPTMLPGYGFHPLERIEALIGICSMQTDLTVNLDSVAYLVNDTLIELAGQQAIDKSEVLKDARNKPIVPWKITGYRLKEALTQWKTTTERLPAARNPKTASDYADTAISKMLGKLEAEGVSAQPDVRSLANWKTDRKPKVAQVLSDDATTAFAVQ